MRLPAGDAATARGPGGRHSVDGCAASTLGAARESPERLAKDPRLHRSGHAIQLRSRYSYPRHGSSGRRGRAGSGRQEPLEVSLVEEVTLVAKLTGHGGNPLLAHILDLVGREQA